MIPLKLDDSDHFLRYGGKDHVSVLKLKVLHSPHVKEHDWEFVETVGIGNQYKHQSLEIFGHVIKDEDLKKLALDLLQSRLLINREGYCYLESEIVPSSSSSLTFSNIEYYRINDLFGWSNYKVAKPKITMVWNRREIERGHIIISLEGEKSTEVNAKDVNSKGGSKVEKDDKNSTSDTKVKENYEKRMQDLIVQMDALQRKLDGLLDSTKKDINANNSQSSTSTSQPQTPTTTTSPPPPPPPLPPTPRKGRYTFETEEYDRILRYCRNSKPDQFIFEIQSYAELKRSLKEAQCHEFESPEFSAGGYKWTLCIYLKGNPNEKANDYISLYLKKQRDQLTRTVNIKLLVRFFIYSFKNNEYLTIQELIVKDFDDQVNTEAGISEALKIKDFEEFSNGLLRGGKCRFGIEVFNLKSHPHTSKLTMVKNLIKRWGAYKFNSYSTLPKDAPSYSQDEVTVDDYKWKLQIYPTGRGGEQSKSFSVFLELVDKDKISNGRHLFADFELRLKDKNSGDYHKNRRVAWFTHSDYNQGFEDFILLSEFNKFGNYTKNDSVTIEVYFNKLFKLEDI